MSLEQWACHRSCSQRQQLALPMHSRRTMKITNSDLCTPFVERDQRPLVVLVDDDRELVDWAAIQLRNAGYAVGLGYNGLEVMDYMSKSVLHPQRYTRPSLLVSDLYMPGLTGLQLAEDLSRAHCLPPWTLMTAFADVEILDGAARLGALAVLQKPFDAEALTRMVKMALS